MKSAQTDNKYVIQCHAFASVTCTSTTCRWHMSSTQITSVMHYFSVHIIPYLLVISLTNIKLMRRSKVGQKEQIRESRRERIDYDEQSRKNRLGEQSRVDLIGKSRISKQSRVVQKEQSWASRIVQQEQLEEYSYLGTIELDEQSQAGKYNKVTRNKPSHHYGL